MTCGVNVPLEFCRGKTFSKVFRWGQSRLAYKPIVAATVAAPCVIEVTAHGVPNGWAYQIKNARGMTELNTTAKQYRQAIVVDANHIEINELDASALDAYIGGGILSYNIPVDLTGYTARMQVRTSVEAATTVLELTTANGGIVIDVALGTITLLAAATATDDFAFESGVYDLELVSAGGEVYQIAYGEVTEEKEVTR